MFSQRHQNGEILENTLAIFQNERIFRGLENMLFQILKLKIMKFYER
jgi:hypothetical protein